MSIADRMATMASERIPAEKSMPRMPEHEGGEQGGAHEMVKSHLAKMHEMHGGKHSHIEHHEDGSHTSHHVGEDGSVSGPHEHDSEAAIKDCDGDGDSPREEHNDDEGLM